MYSNAGVCGIPNNNFTDDMIDANGVLRKNYGPDLNAYGDSWCAPDSINPPSNA